MFRSSQMLSSLLGDWIIVWLSLWRPSFANGCSKALDLHWNLTFLACILGLLSLLWTFLEFTIGHRIKDEKNDKRNYQSYGDFDITCLGNRWTTELFWTLMTMALDSHSEGKPHLAIWLVYPIRCIFFWLNFFCIRKN